MTQGQDAPTSRHCPRCGGLMYKPPGSSFYWHADGNHPRCNITNIAEAALIVQAPEEEPPRETPPPHKGKRPKK